MGLDIVTIEAEWPGGISDGLTLPCACCFQVPTWDYHVTDECWLIVAPEGKRLGVICLSCFDKLAEKKGIDISEYVEFVQFTGKGKTIVFKPVTEYKYEQKEEKEMSNKRSPNFMKLVCHKMASDAIPNGGGLAEGIQLFTEPGRLGDVARSAAAWVDGVILAVKTAPDNPHGDDDEAILAMILERLEDRENEISSDLIK